MSILTITDLNYELPDKVLYKDSSLRLNNREKWCWEINIIKNDSR